MINYSQSSRLLDKSTSKQGRPTIIGAGQSNFGGGPLDVTIDLESQYKQVYNKVKFYQHSSDYKVKFVPLNWADNTSFQSPDQNLRYGCQFYLYPAIQQLLDEDLYVVHHGQGATTLAIDWSPTSTLYNNLIFKTLAAKNAIQDADGIPPSVKFVYWNQGEGDGNDSTQTSNYETNLTALITNFRAITGLTTVPWLIARMGINFTGVPNRAGIRTAQTNVATNMTNVKLVDTDSAGVYADGRHYYPSSAQMIISNNIISVAQANGYI